MKYTKPEIELVRFDVTDVITASGQEEGTAGGGGVLKPGEEWNPTSMFE